MTELTPTEENSLSDPTVDQTSHEETFNLKESTSSAKETFPHRRPASITGSARRALRAQGHHLKPVVQIGQSGLTQGVIEATKVALEQHELIKVSINGESPTERKSGAEQLAEATGAHVAQVIGRVILLYREREKKPNVKKTSSAKVKVSGKKSATKNKR